MIRSRKYDSALKATAFRVNHSEMSRASEDGIAIVVRPQASGTYGVFALDITGRRAHPVGVNWYEVEGKSEVPEAIRTLNRDLDKFHGLGGQMSWRGRDRDKRADTLMAQRVLLRSLDNKD